ncbi:maleylpyruvate isomerase family mycothiol-dependent enzyme [Gordonia sp. zg691]|uniref:Maleylpyruvate isomerase family mycothiol-dependent enzyme n=1 Tax=Gordonia jinghuaiqii TaxID=2758710 RepID=A0A7D7LY53_9ACTN|nr:maleylpyruvate isomerase family mycothiol-dependent enzyme [Gordonia jinghuaiqii]MBD0862949.1 maleylpyruvate isomerase family mycothiol-dependent enzyme [Gordonia jinghuaiqii]MCR5978926.1 maleylpyruvate isomerase family mycothiol-dependent enzyme [Gordonia jinghuaiqii]QMT01736.1 maleylpyruvate isomerase family mycothiol-dependent enzyme [Gordonia jinghuaiqii]
MTAINDASPLLTHYVELADGLAGVLDSLPADAWTNDSPCDGWTGRDVVAHIIGTQREFFTGHDVDLGPAPSLDDPAAAWRAHRDAAAEVLADPAVGDRAFDGHFGPTTIGETLLRFYGFDMIAHRWDVARAGGVAHTFTDAELAEMEAAADSFGDALYSEGVCEKRDVPADADRQTTLLARLGRTV